MTIYSIRYGSHILRYKFLFDRTYSYFKRYCTVSEGAEYDIGLNKEELASYRHFFPPDVPDEYIETKLLISKTSKQLIAYTACIFHSVSFVFNGKAWLLSAPSGTGKTTQYLNWKNMYPEEIRMICGDMPVLEKTEEGEIFVHSSPWNGKERIGGHFSAPLGGIFFLKQGRNNSVRNLTVTESIARMFDQFVVIVKTEEDIHKLASLTDGILRTVSVFEFTNDGTYRSTAKLRKAIIHELQNAQRSSIDDNL